MQVDQDRRADARLPSGAAERGDDLGQRAAVIEVPRVDVRVMLVGHEFNRFVSAQNQYSLVRREVSTARP